MPHRDIHVTSRTRHVSLFFCSLLPALLLYLFTAAWPDTPDGLFHLHRVRGLADALSHGVLYPRWFADFAFGYGYPVLNYYAPAFYYPPALLHLVGFDLPTAVRFTLAASIALSGWWMFRFLRSYISLWPAVVGTVCFQFFPYRFYDLFVRGALPEFVAFMWLPLIAHHTSQAMAVEADGERSAFAKAAVAWAALILTHNLTALMAAIVLVAGLTLVWVSSVLPHPSLAAPWRGKGGGGDRGDANVRRSTSVNTRILTGVATLLLGSLLSAWYAMPALLEARWVAVGHGPRARGYLEHFAPWSGAWNRGFIYDYPAASEPTVSLPFYLIPLVIGALLFLLTRGTRTVRISMGITLLLTCGVLWMTTAGSAWLWNLDGYALAKLQFPWRWQAPAALGVALLVAMLVKAFWCRPAPARLKASPQWRTPIRLSSRQVRKPAGQRLAPELLASEPSARSMEQPASVGLSFQEGLEPRSHAATSRLVQLVGKSKPPDGEEGGVIVREVEPGEAFPRTVAILLSLYFMVYALWGLDYPTVDAGKIEISPTTMWAWDAENGQVGATWTGEFLPIWVSEQRWAIGREPSEESNAQAASALQAVTPLRIGLLGQKLQVRSEEAFDLLFHQFYFPAWQAHIDGKRVTTTPMTDLGLVSISVPAGEHLVNLAWRATSAVWFSRLLTALGALVVLELLRRTTKHRRRLIGIWSMLSVLFLFAASGAGAVQYAVAPVDADYGPIRLEGVFAPPVPRGEVAEIVLFWTVIAPADPLTAFVHVLDDSGTVVAQFDTSPGGRYTPHTRWIPGLLLRSRHNIPLPETLSPGSYRLKAGLYHPATSDAPLVPAGSDAPHVDIGMLVVQP